MKKKVLALCLVFGMSVGAASLMKHQETKTSEAWIGIANYASSQGATQTEVNIIGVMGGFSSAAHGLGWGMAFGGPVGACVGFAVTL